MDFFTIVIIMAIIYLLPELLKKRKSKEYKYPEIPVPPGPDETAPEPMAAEPQAGIHISHSEPSTVSPESQVSYAAAGDSVRKNSWQGNLDQSMVMNGIIFAEIISPPLAKRSRQKVYNNFKDLK